MKVQVTQDFDVVKPNEVYPTRIRAGDVVEGRIAEVALIQKKGRQLHDGGIVPAPVPIAPPASTVAAPPAASPVVTVTATGGDDAPKAAATKIKRGGK